MATDAVDPKLYAPMTDVERDALQPVPPPAERDQAWFERTGHCGKCGQPGEFCRCTPRDACGCRDMHPMGSGLAPTALDAFRVVSDDQGGLW